MFLLIYLSRLLSETLGQHFKGNLQSVLFHLNMIFLLMYYCLCDIPSNKQNAMLNLRISCNNLQ